MGIIKKSFIALFVAGALAGCSTNGGQPSEKDISNSFDTEIVEQMENSFEFERKIEKDNATYYIYNEDNGKTYALKLGSEPYESFDDYDIYIGDWNECTVSGDEIKNEILDSQYFVKVDKKGNIIEWKDSFDFSDACEVDSKC